MIKEASKLKTIWTIGHSTLAAEVFLDMLHSFEIKLLADVRRYPASLRYPHFNHAALEAFLGNNGIDYLHFPDLGGRRQPRPDSINTSWRLAAFRGYADYMETAVFNRAIDSLQHIAAGKNTAYMCAEAPWWRCHRAVISDFLKSTGWRVMHILKAGKAEEHPYTSAAAIVNGKLDYSNNSMRFE